MNFISNLTPEQLDWLQPAYECDKESKRKQRLLLLSYCMMTSQENCVNNLDAIYLYLSVRIEQFVNCLENYNKQEFIDQYNREHKINFRFYDKEDFCSDDKDALIDKLTEDLLLIMATTPKCHKYEETIYSAKLADISEVIDTFEYEMNEYINKMCYYTLNDQQQLEITIKT